jgi:hypothetical protein
MLIKLNPDRSGLKKFNQPQNLLALRPSEAFEISDLFSTFLKRQTIILFSLSDIGREN